MARKQISITLFKKLSALRATLSDEEQALLDNLLLSEDYVSTSAQPDKRADNSGNGVYMETPSHSSPNRRKSPPLRVKFDQAQEAYIIE